MTDTTITGSVAAQLAALPSMPMAELWALWDQHFPRRPAHRNRNYVESRLAYRIQEKAYGALPTPIRRMLVDAGVKYSKIKAATGRSAQTLLMPGTTLIREWDEREYRVTVTPEGLYALDGRVFKNLTAVARHITGTHWNGPKFFGLRDNKGGGRVEAAGKVTTQHDQPLLVALTRAFYWQQLLDDGVMASGSEIAQHEGLHHSTVNELLRLTLLEPAIIQAILAGKQPRCMGLLWFQRNPLPTDLGAAASCGGGVRPLTPRSSHRPPASSSTS